MVRHHSLASKLANFPLPDYLYNWIINNLCDRQHQTRLGGNVSPTLPINTYIRLFTTQVEYIKWNKDRQIDRAMSRQKDDQRSQTALNFAYTLYNASIIQGSGLGPVEYVFTASDLHPISPFNQFCKIRWRYLGYLLVPATKSFRDLTPIRLGHS